MTRDIHETIMDTAVHCRVEGDGPPFVLLHGWGGSADSFLPVARHYAPTHTVYSLDFPGFGASGKPPVPWSVDEYAAMLDAFMERQALVGVPVIAHSFGGRVAILTAARYPGRFSRIILTGSAGLIPRRGIKYYWKVYVYKLMKRMARLSGLRRLLRALGLDIEEWLRARTGSADYRALDETMRATFVRVVNQDLRPFLREIAVPTLLIWGGDDRETPLAFGRIMEREIPDAGLVVFEGAGHFAYLDEFERFVRITDVFLGGER